MNKLDKFEEFWEIYPRKIAKIAARKLWVRCVIKMKLDPEAIIVGARRYAAEKSGSEQTFIAHPSTWLSQQRWTDAPGAPPQSDLGSPKLRDDRALRVIQETILATDIRKKIMERTRWESWSLLEEAADRLNCPPRELWGCIEVDVWRRAWKFALAEAAGGEPAPESIKPTKEDWLSAKERVESRGRHMAGLRNKQWSPLQPAPIIRTEKEEGPNAANHPGTEISSVAREAPRLDRGLGREHPHVGRPAEDPQVVGDQDGDIPAGLT